MTKQQTAALEALIADAATLQPKRDEEREADRDYEQAAQRILDEIARANMGPPEGVNNHSLSGNIAHYRRLAARYGNESRVEAAIAALEQIKEKRRAISVERITLEGNLESRGSKLAEPLLAAHMEAYRGVVDKVAGALLEFCDGDRRLAEEVAKGLPVCMTAFRRTGTWRFFGDDVCGRITGLANRVS